MDLYTIPFQGQYIIYRPLRRLAFVGNRAMARYVKARAAGRVAPAEGEVDAFLEAVDFWQPDPPPPAPWVPGETHRPTLAVLLMTSACNLRCRYCYARGGEDDALRLPLPLARVVIDAAHENALALGADHFQLAFHGGGEPTLHWRALTAAVRHARDKSLPCRISMSSNGLWTKTQRAFILAHFSGISLSFDGIREVQDLQRPRADGGGSFDAVLETIHALDEHTFPYGVRMTVTPDTFARLPESVAFMCEQTRCQAMQVEPSYATARGEYADPTPTQARAFAKAFLSAFEIAARAGRTLLYSGARPWLLLGAFCRAPEEALVVTPEGLLTPCFETHDRRHPLLTRFAIGRAAPRGVMVDQSRVEAFASLQEQRRARCRGCFCYWHCGGDCASRCAASPEPLRVRCQVNRAITRDLLAWYLAAGDGIWRGEAPEGAGERDCATC